MKTVPDVRATADQQSAMTGPSEIRIKLIHGKKQKIN